MRSIARAVAIILSAALMTTVAAGAFSVLKVLAWSVFFAALFRPYLLGRERARGCQLISPADGEATGR